MALKPLDGWQRPLMTVSLDPTKDNGDAPKIIADQIAAISEGITKLREGRLNKKAILLLISHASGIGQRDVERVLDALADLEAAYLKPARAR